MQYDPLRTLICHACSKEICRANWCIVLSRETDAADSHIFINKLVLEISELTAEDEISARDALRICLELAFASHLTNAVSVNKKPCSNP